MERIWLALKTIFAQVLLGLAALFSSEVTYVPAPALPFSPAPIIELATTTPLPATTTLATKEKPVIASSPKLPIKPAPKPPVVETLTPQAITPVVQPVPQPQPVSTDTPSDLNSKTRAALVNILCVSDGQGPFQPISGSGVIIDPRGVVLTNAHVAQFFLLKDYPSRASIECVLRVGSPATATYTATLLHFPSTWLGKNAEKITATNPTGTGEHDYALLYITGRTNTSLPLPTSFPYVSPYTGNNITAGQDVLLAGYPAGFLGGATIQTNLYTSSATAKIADVFTFYDGGDVDLLSIPGTILSQKGASGGAVVRASDSKLIGLIVTASQAESTASRDLRAITLRHINESLIAEKAQTLEQLLSGALGPKAATFNLTLAPTYTQTLVDVLERN